ncbi:TonB-dependent siderophore receptor [Ralstonia solanacearum]|uniref:TonB-dependent siderophore receptor n=1 Tax=Ralstonia solanacearum TaxID=305 RepID=UPI001E5E5619|nr:TonB-dependent siderophore receptor [Ralstonia solanacearum]
MNRHRRPVRRSRVPRLATLAAAALFASTAVAQSRVAIDIPAEPLDVALNALARQAGVQLVFASALTAGKTAPRVQGHYSVEETLHRLLAQTGLTARRQGDDTFTIEAAGSGAEVTLPATVATAAQAESANGPVRGYVARRSATGTKTDAPIEEIPQSISVVTRDRFEAQGAQSVNEALRYTASVSSYGAGTRSDWYTAVRGFVPATDLDGLQLPNTINLASWRVDPWQIERVELLRGPASVLYGQGDPGGTVNIVTKQPTTEPIHEIEVQYGSHARKQVAGDFAGALDADGKLSYRLTALARDGNLPLYLAPYGISPYLSYATSFNPTIGTDRNGQAFRPTKGRQVEAGVKVQAGSKASVTASVFRIHQTNVLTPDLDDPSGTHSTQAGEVRSQGFELEATVQPIAGWNVIAAYTYQDVRNTRANDATLDKWPIAIPTPRQIASLWMDYRIRTGVLQGVGIGAGVRYVSPVAGAPDNALKVPGYALFDAALFYNVGRHWRLALNGTNLANREVISGCYDATRCIYANGRTVLASAKYAW